MNFLLFGGDVHLASWYLLQSTKSCQLTGYLRFGITKSPSLVFFCDYLRHPPQTQKVGRLVSQVPQPTFESKWVGEPGYWLVH